MPRWLPALVCVLVFVGACGDGGGSSASPTPCATPSPARDLSALPKDLPFEQWGTVTKAQQRKRFVIAQVVSEDTIVELHPQIARALIDAGYEIVGADNEGFESEIFFAPGKGLTGLFRLRQGPCKGQVTATLFFEPINDER